MKQLEQELDALRSQVIAMGSLTESMLGQAVEAVEKTDSTTVDDVFEAEEKLDQLQIEIDQEAIRIMTVHSPVARDLRMVLSVSRITAEMERIGDHATNICESLQLMTAQTNARPIQEVLKMGGFVVDMVRGALNAFAQKDAKKAKETISSDDMVDALNDMIVKRLLSNADSSNDDQTNMAVALSQILIASSLERIADQATNISEEVVYMVDGSDIRHTAV